MTLYPCNITNAKGKISKFINLILSDSNILILIKNISFLRFISVFALLFLLLPVNASEVPIKEWDEVFGGSGFDEGKCIQQTSDGGSIIAGYTTSFGAGGRDIWLIKTDANGNKIWDKTFGGSGNDEGKSVQPTQDGYIITGWTDSFGSGASDVWLIKTDLEGDKVWDRTFGGWNSDGGNAVIQTNDEGYAIAGSTSTYGAGGWDGWLIKTDRDGTKLWDLPLGGLENDDIKAILQLDDGSYIVAGGTDSYAIGTSDAWLIKVDPDGNKLWDKPIGGSGYDKAESLTRASNGGYIFTGETDSSGAGGLDVWIAKTDSDGNKLWDYPFGGAGTEYGWSIDNTNDGGYIITSGETSSGAGGYDVGLIKVDASGNKIWDCTFGGIYSDWGCSVKQSSDGSYIVTGGTGFDGPTAGDLWLLKVGWSSIGDLVWNDLNGDGIRDQNENGIEGVTVSLYKSGESAIFKSTQTDASGLYLFDNLEPGEYQVEFELQEGYAFSPKDQGADDAVDSDADVSTGKTSVIALNLGEKLLTCDAGMTLPKSSLAFDPIELEKPKINRNGISFKISTTLKNLGTKDEKDIPLKIFADNEELKSEIISIQKNRGQAIELDWYPSRGEHVISIVARNIKEEYSTTIDFEKLDDIPLFSQSIFEDRIDCFNLCGAVATSIYRGYWANNGYPYLLPNSNDPLFDAANSAKDLECLPCISGSSWGCLLYAVWADLIKLMNSDFDVSKPHQLTWDRVKELIRNSNPFIGFIENPNHFYVISGWIEEGDNRYYSTINQLGDEIAVTLEGFNDYIVATEKSERGSTNGIIIGDCPIDLRVEDPEGFILEKTRSEIPNAEYNEFSIYPIDESDILIFIPEMKKGIYMITAMPKPNSKTTDKYTIRFYGFNDDLYVARDVPLINLPIEPYTLIVNNESATQPPLQALDCVANYIQGLPSSAFDKPTRADERKKTFSNRLNSIMTQIKGHNYCEAIEKLRNDIRAKADGSLGGNPNDDLVMDKEAQQDICKMVDDLIVYLETYGDECIEAKDPNFMRDIESSEVGDQVAMANGNGRATNNIEIVLG